jgi:ion channel-forming bestrophin family protein
MLVFSRRRTWLRLVFSFRASPLYRTRYRLLFVFALSLSVAYLDAQFHIEFPISLPEMSLLGMALGIFLGFRNSAAYDRFWEGRKLWGRLINVSRSLARDLVCFAPDTRDGTQDRRLVYRVICFAHALRMHLRERVSPSELSPFVPEPELNRVLSSRNLPNALVLELGRDLAALHREGRFGEYRWVELTRWLGELTDIQGGCERIKNSPIPQSYSILIHQIVALYVVSLPLGLVESLGWVMPPFVLLIAYTFLGLDAVGDEIEEPFGEDLNDLPLGSMCRTIEINLRELLGESELPPPSLPVRGVLS